jgi:hypothetical protein
MAFVLPPLQSRREVPLEIATVVTRNETTEEHSVYGLNICQQVSSRSLRKRNDLRLKQNKELAFVQPGCSVSGFVRPTVPNEEQDKPLRKGEIVFRKTPLAIA